MENPDPIEIRLRRIQGKFSRFYAKILPEFGLTIPQFSLLLLVADEGPLRMGELAKRLHLASSSITNLVDRLEAKRLLKRLPDSEDRRAFQIGINAKGEKAVASIRNRSIVKIAKGFEQLSEKELAMVHRFYDIMEGTLDELLTRMKGKLS